MEFRLPTPPRSNSLRRTPLEATPYIENKNAQPWEALEKIKAQVDTFLDSTTGRLALDVQKDLQEQSNSTKCIETNDHPCDVERKKRSYTDDIENVVVTPSKPSNFGDILELSRKKQKLEVDHLRQKIHVEHIQCELEKADAKTAKLESQLLFLSNEVKSTRTELQQKTQDFQNQKKNMEEQISNLQSQLGEKEVNYSTLQKQYHEMQLNYLKLKEINDLKEHHNEVDTEGKVRALEIQIENLNDLRVSEMRMMKDELFASQSELKTLQLEKAGNQQDIDLSQLNQRLRDELDLAQSRQRQLEKQVIQLTESQKNIKLLEEQLIDQASKLQSRNKTIANQEEIVTKYNLLVEEKSKWMQDLLPFTKEARAEGIVGGEDNPFLIVLQLYKLRQKEQLSLLEVQGQLEVKIKMLERKVDDLTKKLNIEENWKTEAEAKLLNNEIELKRMSIARGYEEKQNANLNNLLDSYILESTLKGVVAGGGGGVPGVAEEGVIETESREKSFSSTLATANARIKELEDQLAGALSPKVLEPLEKQIVVLQEQLKKSQLLLNQAESESIKLRASLGRGEFNHATTKVVHMAKNPTSKLFPNAPEPSEMLALRKENLRLKKLVENWSSSPSTSLSLKVKQENETPCAALPHETVDGLKLRIKRLKEVFRDKIQRFREAVVLLTGFKVDMIQSECTQLRLRSTFTEKEEDDLLFNWTEDGLQIVSTDFTSKLDLRLFTYLEVCHSIPAFLSSLTLQLFEQQTFVG